MSCELTTNLRKEANAEAHAVLDGGDGHTSLLPTILLVEVRGRLATGGIVRLDLKGIMSRLSEGFVSNMFEQFEYVYGTHLNNSRTNQGGGIPTPCSLSVIASFYTVSQPMAIGENKKCANV